MFNIFDHCDVKSLIEIMFVGILPSFRKRGIAKELFKVSIDIARELKAGNNVKVSVNDSTLALGNPPEIVTGIFTTFVTQKIARSLNFQLATKINFDKFVYDGYSLSTKVNNDTPYLTYEYLKL